KSGAREHEVDERLVERLAHVLGVVLGKKLRRSRAQLDRGEAVALRLDAAQHFAAESTCDAVRLDQDESAFRHGASLAVTRHLVHRAASSPEERLGCRAKMSA